MRKFVSDLQICPAATMAGLDDMNNFVTKFVSLWKSGKNASLKVESKSGRAVVMLELDLGFPHPPPSHPPPQHHHQQVKVGAARVRRHERRAAGRQEAEKQTAEIQEAERHAVEDAATCAGNAPNYEEGNGKMAIKQVKEIAKEEETAMKEGEVAKKVEKAAKASESAGRNVEQFDAIIEAKNTEEPCVLGTVGDRGEMKTEKVAVNEGESREAAGSANLSIELVSDNDVIDTNNPKLRVVEKTVNDVTNLYADETKVSDGLKVDCESELSVQGVDFIPPPAPPIPLGLLDPVENEFPGWDRDDDNGCMPLTARRLREQKRYLWKIVRNPDGTITTLKNKDY